MESARMADMKTRIGRAIAARRTALGYKQSECGDASGLGQRMWSRLESGAGQTIEKLDAAAQVLGWSVAEDIIASARELPDADETAA